MSLDFSGSNRLQAVGYNKFLSFYIDMVNTCTVAKSISQY